MINHFILLRFSTINYFVLKKLIIFFLYYISCISYLPTINFFCYITLLLSLLYFPKINFFSLIICLLLPFFYFPTINFFPYIALMLFLLLFSNNNVFPLLPFFYPSPIFQFPNIIIMLIQFFYNTSVQKTKKKNHFLKVIHFSNTLKKY